MVHPRSIVFSSLSTITTSHGNVGLLSLLVSSIFLFYFLGVFHTVYKGVFAQDMPWYWAVYGNYPPIIALPIASLLLFTAACVVGFGGTIGIKPKRYTVEWLEAQKERDRIENSNAVTNYLDRRRKERGSHWLLKEYMPEHVYFLWMGSNHHDTELLRNRED